ncbi:hypothetical protein [Rouxiella sp. WC2420]|uniref:Uncharacterized protein n=1 Tax=Rouxiella sp. WC2420 TaxID=3234145 RepID=A0AB39VVT4_9GAMM
MILTLDMMIHGIATYEAPEDFFQYVKTELQKQVEPDAYREVTMENVVKKTTIAIDFFIKELIVDKAVAETDKSRSEIENIINKIEDYSLN